MQSSQSGEMRVTLSLWGWICLLDPWVWHGGRKAGGQLRLGMDICSDYTGIIPALIGLTVY